MVTAGMERTTGVVADSESEPRAVDTAILQTARGRRVACVTQSFISTGKNFQQGFII
jgi:hypothetical protein